MTFRTSTKSQRDCRTNPANIATGYDTGSTHESGTDVGDDSPVQIGHHHNIELAGSGDKLHRSARQSFLKLTQIDMIKYIRIVDNHIIILDARRLILFRNSSEGVEEKTITEFHDVCFMYASDFLFECCT